MGGLVCAVGWLIYAAKYEKPQLEYLDQPIKLLKTTVHPGDSVPIVIERLSHYPDTRTYQISRSLVCNTLPRPLLIRVAPESVEPGYSKVTATQNVVPTTITNDDGADVPFPMMTTERGPRAHCHMDGLTEIQGIIRTIQIKWVTEEFDVVP